MVSRGLRRTWLVAALLAVSACDCGGGGVGSTTAGFRTTTGELDFGAALEGTRIARSFEITATGRADVLVDVVTEEPFSAPTELFVPGGSTSTLTVTFAAGTAPAEGALTLSARGESFAVRLRGEGVRVLDCVPTAQCRNARFVLESRQCEESLSEDGAGCAPTDLCLENGVCKAGECLGTPRSCSDGNACTQDACSSEVGCIHVDVSSQCPKSMNPCVITSCDPMAGCGMKGANDETICGSVDCVTAHLCSAGSCMATPTPEGFLCLPATPCQGEGRCTMGECVRPDAGVMTPAWTVPLGPAPSDPFTARGSLLARGGNLYLHGCALLSQDGGCALLSYTSNGFLRFETPTEPGARLHAASGFGALLSVAGELRAYALAGGARSWTAALGGFAPAEAADGGMLELASDGVAISQDGGVLLALSWSLPASAPVDGGAGDAGAPDAGSPDAGDAGAPMTLFPGVTLVELQKSDGGVMSASNFPDAGARSAVALTARGALWLFGAGTAAFAVRAPDGGWEQLASADVADAGTTLSLGSTDGGAFMGAARARFEDGGVALLPGALWPDGGERPSAFEVLSTSDTSFIFFDVCRSPHPPPCTEDQRQLWVRAFDPLTRSTLWEAQVLPGEAAGQLIDAALPAGSLTGAIATLTQAELPLTGPRADLQLFAAGERAILCPLQGAPRVGAALFEGDSLYVLVDRAGTWRLEAYALNGTGFLQTGWPRASSINGTRRER